MNPFMFTFQLLILFHLVTRTSTIQRTGIRSDGPWTPHSPPAAHVCMTVSISTNTTRCLLMIDCLCRHRSVDSSWINSWGGHIKADRTGLTGYPNWSAWLPVCQLYTLCGNREWNVSNSWIIAGGWALPDTRSHTPSTILNTPSNTLVT